MADFDSETVPLLQLDLSVNNEGEFDESRETESSDDECDVEDNVSHLEQPGPSSDHSSIADQSQTSNNASKSKLGKGQDALCYFAGDALTSSEDSSKVSSAASSVDVDCIVEYTTDEQGNVDYIDIDFDDTISDKHVAELMNKMRLNHYTAISCEGDFTISKCRLLFERDYYCEMIENPGGSLSLRYPARMIIPVARKSQTESSERLDAVDFDKSYYEKIRRSVYSRLLTRFVVPVIMFDKKFICRSGSLTVRKSAVYESARQREVPKSHDITTSVLHQVARTLASTLADFTNRSRRAASQLFFPNSMWKLRDVDAEILRDLNVQHICDLMVEDRKMYKKTIRISSSEKINKDIYKDCEIQQMPYPGCHFFRRYHEANCIPNCLVFDWERKDVNTVLKFSVDPNEIFPNIKWADYKEWDIINLTRNYFRMILFYLSKDAGGMLVHCISGWDRTPLFISLLRLSLWADGIIHESLDYTEMAYLTLAYDWYLFGHNLPRRLEQNQEIMHFCFNFLYFISRDDFSLTRIFHSLPDDEKRGRVFPEYVPLKRRILITLQAYVLSAYSQFITDKLN